MEIGKGGVEFEERSREGGGKTVGARLLGSDITWEREGGQRKHWSQIIRRRGVRFAELKEKAGKGERVSEQRPDSGARPKNRLHPCGGRPSSDERSGGRTLGQRRQKKRPSQGPGLGGTRKRGAAAGTGQAKNDRSMEVGAKLNWSVLDTPRG